MSDPTAQLAAAARDYIADMGAGGGCNRVLYSQCMVRRCLIAGGWTMGQPLINATCPRWRLEQALQAVEP